MIFQDFSKTFKDCLHFQSLEFAACKFKYKSFKDPRVCGWHTCRQVEQVMWSAYLQAGGAGDVVGVPVGRWSR